MAKTIHRWDCDIGGLAKSIWPKYQGRKDAALPEFCQALDIMSKHLPPTHQQIQKLSKTAQRLEQQAATPAGA